MGNRVQHLRKGTKEFNPNRLPGDPQKWVEALAKEWRSWIFFGAVEVATQEQIDKLHPDDILPMRALHTDKNETARNDDPTLDIFAKCRIIIPGFKNKSGKLVK